MLMIWLHFNVRLIQLRGGLGSFPLEGKLYVTVSAKCFTVLNSYKILLVAGEADQRGRRVDPPPSKLSNMYTARHILCQWYDQ